MEETQYVCPGETHPISRSVHLSRLASGYPACRVCPLRFDTGHLPSPSMVRLQKGEPRRQKKSLFTDEGVRGVYLNELARKEAHLIAAALAAVLWEQKPLKGRFQSSGKGNGRNGPTVLIGHDDRPAAPDLITGVTAGLRRMGCQVVDIGLTAKPGFWFAADHLPIQAGIYVNGGNGPPAEMALDFVAGGARPLSKQPRFARDSSSLTLDAIEAAIRDPYHRASRQSGSYRAFQAAVPYQAGLWKHFQALKTLKVCLATGSRLVAKTLRAISDSLPGEIVAVSLPHRVRNPLDPRDADVLRASKAVREHQADVGVLVDDDGQRLAFLDEAGQLVSVTQTTRLLAEVRHEDFPNDPIVLDEFATAELEILLKRAGMRVVRGGETLAQMSESLRGHRGSFGGGSTGRYWFREAFPTSDAIIALATVLKAITRANTPLSKLV